MKVLYLGLFQDSTGYANAANETVLSLDAVGIDVVCRKITLSGFNGEYPSRIQELENKDLNGVTHCIQHYLPPMFHYNNRCKQIGYFHYETTHFKPSNWQYYCDIMDQIVVACRQNLHACQNSLVNKPISVINQATDITKYSKEYPPISLGFDTKRKFVFYAVGDFSVRKNYMALIRAYLTTFTKDDDVVLVLKTYISGLNAEESEKKIVEAIKLTKERLRKNIIDVYPPIILVTQRFSDEQMMSLHQMSDCFVSVEKGAGWGIPLFDACGFGKQVITTNWGGAIDFVENNGYLINGQLEPVYGMDNLSCPFPDLYTSYEEWYEPNFNILCSSMKKAYLKGKNCLTDKDTLKTWLNKFSYESIGNQWKKMLENL